MYELDALQLLLNHVHAGLVPFCGGHGRKPLGEADEPDAEEVHDLGEDKDHNDFHVDVQAES